MYFILLIYLIKRQKHNDMCVGKKKDVNIISLILSLPICGYDEIKEDIVWDHGFPGLE